MSTVLTGASRWKLHKQTPDKDTYTIEVEFIQRGKPHWRDSTASDYDAHGNFKRELLHPATKRSTQSRNS